MRPPVVSRFRNRPVPAAGPARRPLVVRRAPRRSRPGEKNRPDGTAVYGRTAPPRPGPVHRFRLQETARHRRWVPAAPWSASPAPAVCHPTAPVACHPTARAVCRPVDRRVVALRSQGTGRCAVARRYPVTARTTATRQRWDRLSPAGLAPDTVPWARTACPVRTVAPAPSLGTVYRARMPEPARCHGTACPARTVPARSRGTAGPARTAVPPDTAMVMAVPVRCRGTDDSVRTVGRPDMAMVTVVPVRCRGTDGPVRKAV